MRVTKSIVGYIAGLLVLVMCNSEAAERKFIKVTVEPGGEVLVCDHKNWDKTCKPLPVPTIKVTHQPANGTVAVRSGTFVVKNPWHPDAERTCIGRSFPGLGVYYLANSTFRGVATFEYEVTVGYHNRRFTFEVDVEVTVK